MVQKVVGSIPISHPMYPARNLSVVIFVLTNGTLSCKLGRDCSFASVVQRLVYKFSKLGTRVRFSPLAPVYEK